MGIKINWDTVPDENTREPVPDGTYLARLERIEEAQTINGDPMWRLGFAIEEPAEQAGRFLFDNMVFSVAAQRRAKLICKRLGLNLTGEVELTPSMIKGKKCFITTMVKDYVDKNGTTKKRNEIPFDGYSALDSGATATSTAPTTPAATVAASAGNSSEINLPF